MLSFLLSPISSINLFLLVSFPTSLKAARSFHSHLKKGNLDKGDLSNYRPIYHLSLLSKLTERVVKLSLTEYLSNNNLILNSFQTAYIKHHSSE